MTKHKRSKRRFKRLLIALLLLSPLLLLGAVHVWGYVKVQMQVRAIQEAGDPATLQDLDDLARETPIQKDAGAFYTEVFACLAFDEMDKGLRYQLPSCWRIESGKQAWPLPEEDRECVQEVLEADEETLTLLKEAPKIQGRVFDGSYVDWRETFVLTIEPLRGVVELLVLNAIYAANQADGPTVWESLQTALHVAETLREEPFAFSQGQRRNLIYMAVSALEWASGVVACSQDQQQSLDQQLQNIQWPMSLRDRLVNGRCVYRSLYHDPDPEILKDLGLSQRRGEPIPTGWITALKWSGLLRCSEALFLEQSEQSIDACLKWKPGANLNVRRLFPSADGPLPVTLAPMFLSYAEWECVWPLRIGARLQVLRGILAARRFQQQTGQWPQSLDELVPDYLDAIPTDPYADTPIQYRLRQGGRAIFSVGVDLQASQERYFRDKRNHQTSDDIIIWLEAPEENPDR